MDHLSPDHGPDHINFGPKSGTNVPIRTGTVIWSGPLIHGLDLEVARITKIFII